jgi:hypothetical protein
MKGRTVAKPKLKLSDHEFAMLWGIAIHANRQSRRVLADGRILLKLEKKRYVSRSRTTARHLGRGKWPRASTPFYLLKRGMRAIMAETAPA